jgi:hypothetical protein
LLPNLDNNSAEEKSLKTRILESSLTMNKGQW